MSEQKEFTTTLANASNKYMALINKQMDTANVQLGDYAKSCVMNAISAINVALETAGVSWNAQDLNRDNIGGILLNIASLQLNAAAQPAEVYFQLRTVKGKDGSYMKKIEYGVQGAGFESIAARFGRDVKRVMPCWEVRENDDFKYPRFTGLEYAPPEWTPKGSGAVVRVVYPIIYNDNTVNYIISERADVKKNLLAHINNNLMNETFGICKNRYNATEAQKEEIEKKKSELKSRARKHETLEDILDDAELDKYISPAWKDGHSRESMIVRKMKNNAMKGIPKDFGSAFIQSQYMESTSEDYVQAKEDIIENTASIAIDVTPEVEILPETGENTTDEQQVTLNDIPGVFE